jgi:hypothetical protein
MIANTPEEQAALAAEIADDPAPLDESTLATLDAYAEGWEIDRAAACAELLAYAQAQYRRTTIPRRCLRRSCLCRHPQCPHVTRLAARLPRKLSDRAPEERSCRVTNDATCNVLGSQSATDIARAFR